MMRPLVLWALFLGVLAWPSAAPRETTLEVALLEDRVQTLKEQNAALQVEIERCGAERADWRARAQSAALTAANQQLQRERQHVDETLIRALGGDPAHGDTLDRATDPPTLKQKDAR